MGLRAGLGALEKKKYLSSAIIDSTVSPKYTVWAHCVLRPCIWMNFEMFCMPADSECGCPGSWESSSATGNIAGQIQTNGRQPFAGANSKQIPTKWGMMLIS